MWICHSENRALRYGHYSVVTWALAHTKSLTTWLFTTWLVWSKNKRNITYRHYWVFAIGITDYSTLCLKIIAWLTTKKTPKPSYGWCNHLGLFIYIYIYTSYRLHPIKLPSSVISDNFAYRRLAANLSGSVVRKQYKVRVCRFGARCTMPPCFSVVNLREIGGPKEAQAGKNFSEASDRVAPSWRR